MTNQPMARASDRPASPLPSRLFAVSGPLLAACAVALAAYASHGATGTAQARLGTAAAFAFGHGLALAALAPRAAGSRLAQASLAAMLLGTLLFAGGLAWAVFTEGNAAVAPFGGMLLIGAWLAFAVAALRG